jgi:hypothetical protein
MVEETGGVAGIVGEERYGGGEAGRESGRGEEGHDGGWEAGVGADSR